MVSTNASVFSCVLSAWQDDLVCAALLYGWPQALGWRGHCKVHTTRIFCVTVNAGSFVRLREVKPPSDTVVRGRKKPQLRGLY